MAIEYITQRMKGAFEVDRYGGNEAAYLGMEIMKVKNEDFEGVVLDSNKYESKINHIGISHDRMITTNEILTESDKQFYGRSWGD